MPEQYIADMAAEAITARWVGSLPAASSCSATIMPCYSYLVNSMGYARASGNRGIVVKKGVSTFAAARHFFLERVVIGKQKKVKHCGERPM